ncbi:hypothetical protein JE971_004136 [Salmonella enterica subsp. enterica serovar Agona]|nr:hypothetical protein [Salmonella enterica subsp. enterica serovar Agona]
MCGRFSQSMTREDYLSLIADEADRDITYDPVPIGRYNVAPGTRVLLLSERDEQLHLDPVHWGYAPGWWDKTPLINARMETAASSRMFKSLRLHGRAICFADGWFEWKKEGDKKQPYFIGVSLDIENYCTLRLFFDLSTLAGLSRRNLPESGIRLIFQI